MAAGRAAGVVPELQAFAHEAGSEERMNQDLYQYNNQAEYDNQGWAECIAMQQKLAIG